MSLLIIVTFQLLIIHLNMNIHIIPKNLTASQILAKNKSRTPKHTTHFHNAHNFSVGRDLFKLLTIDFSQTHTKSGGI